MEYVLAKFNSKSIIGSSFAPILGGAISGMVAFLLILSVIVVTSIMMFYQHHKYVKCRNQLHEPDCK